MRSLFPDLKPRGFALFSLLPALLLACAASLVLFRDAHNFVRYYMELVEESSVLRREIKLRELLISAARDIDSSTFPIPPVIHPAGTVQFADGAQNPVNFGANPPQAGSQALSIIAVDGSRLLRVLRADTEGANAQYFACAEHHNTLPHGKLSAFIGLGVDGIVYINADTAQNHLRPYCYTVDAREERNMFIGGADFSLLSVRVLAPVIREYTLYLSCKGDLRYLGHKGSENIENQPLFGNIQRAVFSSRFIEPANAYSIAVEARFSEMKIFHYAHASQLGRAPGFNILFN